VSDGEGLPSDERNLDPTDDAMRYSAERQTGDQPVGVEGSGAAGEASADAPVDRGRDHR
jgi:hypothetical protein